MSSGGLPDPHHVSFDSGVTVLGDAPVVDQTPDIQIHAPVCPDVTEDADMDSVEAVLDVPVPVIFYKMAAGGNFGCPKFTFDRISGHFRSLRNLIFVSKCLTKWPPAAIFYVRKSLSISLLAISDPYKTFC